MQNERRRVSLQVDYGNEDVTDMAESKRESLGSYASCLVLNASQNNNRSIEVSLEQNKMGPPYYTFGITLLLLVCTPPV